MVWRLQDSALQMGAELIDGQVITFGSADCSDVDVCETPATVEGQCVADGAFLFCRVRNRSFVLAARGSLRVGKRSFIASCDQTILDDLLHRECDESTVASLVDSSLFHSALERFRNAGCQVGSHSGSASLLLRCEGKISEAEFAELLCPVLPVLDGAFWEVDEVTSQAARKLYISLLWSIWARTFGLGPLSLFAFREDITEILVKRFDSIYVEQNGVLRGSPLRFASEDELLALIERMAAGAGRRVDESQPFCDARLADGSRMHAIIPPIAIDGACLTIRRFRERAFSGDELVARGSLSEATLSFLRDAVANRKNILVSGGTGSGKTTLLNVLSSFVSNRERVLTIEDSAELRLSHPHVVRLESRVPNSENRGEVTLRTLVRNALRMRPDRIVVGECRGAEAFDMLQAMNTGHLGSMTTIHANSALDALRRLELLILLSAENLEARAVREQIGAVIEIVVHLSRDHGVRRVVEVVQLCGVEPHGEGYRLERIL